MAKAKEEKRSPKERAIDLLLSIAGDAREDLKARLEAAELATQLHSGLHELVHYVPYYVPSVWQTPQIVPNVSPYWTVTCGGSTSTYLTNGIGDIGTSGVLVPTGS